MAAKVGVTRHPFRDSRDYFQDVSSSRTGQVPVSESSRYLPLLFALRTAGERHSPVVEHKGV